MSFELGRLVWDSNNKRYGVIIATFGEDDDEVRLDSDGVQPKADLHPLFSPKDKGTKKKLIEAISAYNRLCKNYPQNNYPELILK